jgi:hypothetical protein
MSGVLVIAELAGDDEPDATVYVLTDVARSANLLQARVPLTQLCPLAADPAVSLVRPPAARTPLASLSSNGVRNPPEKARCT